MPTSFMPCAVRNVGRHRRRKFLAFHHSFSQPVKPLVECLSLECATTFLRINLEFLPGNKDGTAKKIIDQIKRNFATKHHHPKSFPSDRNQVNWVFTVRSEHFVYFSVSAPSGNDCTRRSVLVTAGLWNDLTSSSIASL